MKEQVHEAIKRSLAKLLEKDGYLFECPIETEFPYDARKLHEVCINHRLANHLEREVLPFFAEGDPLFVDIEFNREGINYKGITIEGEDKCVRPDIIIHNRRSGNEKFNLLIAECKKEGSRENDIDHDRKKIEALMLDEKYSYSFGLHVVYGKISTTATFYSKGNNGIETDTIDLS